MNYCYLTMLSSPNYLPGVIALARSLRSVGAKYPLLCVIPRKLGGGNEMLAILRKLASCNITAKVLNQSISDHINVQNPTEFSHWTNTFDKLLLFNLDAKVKYVYIDADMWVCSNIDWIFDRPFMSSCAAGYFLNTDWTRLNSGLMVIENDGCFYRRLKDQMNVTINNFCKLNQSIGDQDIINDAMPEWSNCKNLHLPQGVNMFFKHLTSAYKRGYSFKAKDREHKIYVVHFIGKVKPWDYKGIYRYLFPFKLLISNPYGCIVWMKYRNACGK